MKEERVSQTLPLQSYETVFILPADYTPQRVDEFLEKLKAVIVKGGGEITQIDKWGRRRLAYPIQRNREGFYVFVLFKAPGALLAEVDRFFLVNEDVIRNILCKALKGKPGSPTMSVPAPLLQIATAPYMRPNPMAPGAPAAPGAAPHAAPAAAPAAPSAPAAQPS
jgi:small subunit ribosomal protein S6